MLLLKYSIKYKRRISVIIQRIVTLGMTFLVLLSGNIIAQDKTASLPLSSIQQDKIGQTASVEGRILNVLAPRSEKAPYNLYLTDGTDTLFVVIWEDVFKAISGVDKLKPGANVRLTGTVNQYRGNLQFTINKSQDVILPGENAQASETQIVETKTSIPAPSLPAGILPPGRIDRTHIGQEVVVQGRVKEFKPSWSETAPYSITLQDDSGTLRVVYWSDVAKVLGSSWEARPGQVLRIGGKVSAYRDNLQLKVSQAGDIVDAAASEISAPATPDPVLPQTSQSESSTYIPLGSLTREYIGKTVKIKGKVVDAMSSKQGTDPFKITIMDSSGVFLAVYWSSVDEKLNPEQKPVVGKDFEFEGQIIVYKNELHLLVIDPQKISPCAATPQDSSDSSSISHEASQPATSGSPKASSGSESNPLVIPVGELSQAYVGKYVRVKGTIEKITPAWQPTAPHTIILADDKGKINVVYWADVADNLKPEQKPQNGQTIQVEGKVKEFKGELQIKIYKAADLVILKSGNSSINAPATKAPDKPVSQSQSRIQEGSGQNAQILPLGSVTREYLDKYVKVQGKVVEITPSWMPSAPNSVVLSDGQAKIKVVYWSDVADNLKPEQKPAIDAVLLVEGKVDEYRGELQIKVEKPDKISLVK